MFRKLKSITRIYTGRRRTKRGSAVSFVNFRSPPTPPTHGKRAETEHYYIGEKLPKIKPVSPTSAAFLETEASFLAPVSCFDNPFCRKSTMGSVFKFPKTQKYITLR